MTEPRQQRSTRGKKKYNVSESESDDSQSIKSLDSQNQDSDSESSLHEEAKPPLHKKNDIVWAKVRGYSWWPANVGEVHYPKTDVGGKPCYEVKYKIFFVGDNTNCVLS
jgi:hypothetical protein